MRRLTFLGAMIATMLILLAACSSQSDEASDRALELNEQATELMREAWGDEEKLEQALVKLEMAIEENPEMSAARSNQINVLLQLGRHEESIEAMEQLIALTGQRQYRLMLCMVEEVTRQTKKSNTSCYEDVADYLSEKKGEDAYSDPDYVLALKMADSDRFPTAVERFLASLENEMDRDGFQAMLVESSREEILKSMVPPPSL